MDLPTFFSLTPKSPQVCTYNPSNPNAPYTYAHLYSYGGNTKYYGDYRLAGQYNNNEIILGYDPVGLSEQTITNWRNDVSRRSAIYFNIYQRNISSENQFLLLLALRGLDGNPNAQIFIGTDLIRTEPLAGDERVAILMDCLPGDTIVHVYVRLASDTYWAGMGFKGVDCYLL